MNDKSHSVKVQALLNYRDFDGTILRTVKNDLSLEPGSSQQFYSEDLPDSSAKQDQFLELILQSDKGEEISRNVLFLDVPRMCSMKDTDVKMRWIEGGDATMGRIELTCQKPAFYVYLTGKPGNRVSDNGFHLMPGEVKVIECQKDEQMTLTHLRQTY